MIPLIRSNQPPLIVGHRGARAHEPENTILGFHHAMTGGADFIECDVHLSQDKQVVVIHDDHLLRTTGVDAWVQELSWEQLRKLNAGGDQRIPSLKETLQWLKRQKRELMLAIEIKTSARDSRKMAAPVLEVIRSEDCIERCLVISFDLPTLVDIKALCPELRTGFLFISTQLSIQKAIERAQTAHIDCLWPSLPGLTQEGVEQAHQKGLGVFTWLVQDETSLRLALKCQVDGMGSDTPGELRELLLRTWRKP
ncbi:MAG: glycerophosphodiester phosphodiesterase [Bdellovibrionia bacterium]